jgi:hypothetical protein
VSGTLNVAVLHVASADNIRAQNQMVIPTRADGGYRCIDCRKLRVFRSKPDGAENRKA